MVRKLAAGSASRSHDCAGGSAAQVDARMRTLATWLCARWAEGAKKAGPAAGIASTPARVELLFSFVGTRVPPPPVRGDGVCSADGWGGAYESLITPPTLVWEGRCVPGQRCAPAPSHRLPHGTASGNQHSLALLFQVPLVQMDRAHTRGEPGKMTVWK